MVRSDEKGRGTGETTLGIRVASEDLDRLKKLVDGLGGLTSISGLARAAMRLGLDRLEEDPTLLVRQLKPRRGGK